ncbi:MAG: hypothetical protein AAB228_02975 [Nitrospirota bacterium]
MDISKKILSDPINKWVFKTAQELNTDIYIVGGYMRDLLSGVKSNDKDFALKNNIEYIANKTAKKNNGTFIVLKHKQTYRVVLKNKEVLDFSYLNGSINNDLKGRDFTIDAIAWSPKTEIIDPFSGRNDLNKRIIKAVMIKNLLNDPLRIIRAYRIAAELGFKIETNTRKYLKIYSPKITKAASERITEEFFKILTNKNPVNYLNECYTDKVLIKILQKKHNKKINALNQNMNLLNKLDLFLKNNLKDKKISHYLDEEISQKLNRLGLLRLSTLFRNYSIANSNLRVSNNINKALKDIHNGMEISTGKISDTELYKIFYASGERIFEMSFLLAFISKKNIKEIFKRADEYLKIKNKILLNGDDVQRILNIEPGIKVGNILSALQEEKFKGTIKTRAEARKWLLSNFT